MWYCLSIILSFVCPSFCLLPKHDITVTEDSLLVFSCLFNESLALQTNCSWQQQSTFSLPANLLWNVGSLQADPAASEQTVQLFQWQAEEEQSIMISILILRQLSHPRIRSRSLSCNVFTWSHFKSVKWCRRLPTTIMLHLWTWGWTDC